MSDLIMLLLLPVIIAVPMAALYLCDRVIGEPKDINEEHCAKRVWAFLIAGNVSLLFAVVFAFKLADFIAG